MDVEKTEETGNTNMNAEAAKFLDRDFNQCFLQLRHYDLQIFELCKFSFLTYTTLIGGVLGLYQVSRKEKMDLDVPIMGVLAVSISFGLFIYCLMVRNRIYFVQATRYINEHRGFFLRQKPLGFLNQSKMYTNHKQPPFFDWKSTQALYMYLSAALNSFLIFLLAIFLFPSTPKSEAGMMSGACFAVQLLFGIVYLNTREDRSAAEAVFGKEQK